MPKAKRSTGKRIRNKARRAARSAESFARATQRSCPQNEAMTVHHFAARGVNPDDITPRVNVFTVGAWNHKGRSVRKGEKGCPLTVWIDTDKGKGDDGPDVPALTDGARKDKGSGGIRPKTTYVFHVSQTVPKGHQDGAEPLPLASDDPRVIQAEPVPAVAPVAEPEPKPEPKAAPAPATSNEPEPAFLF